MKSFAWTASAACLSCMEASPAFALQHCCEILEPFTVVWRHETAQTETGAGRAGAACALSSGPPVAALNVHAFLKDPPGAVRVAGDVRGPG